MAENIGTVVSVSGPAVDIQFEERAMPPIYQALRIVSDGFDVPEPLSVIVEVQQHLGEGRVRTIAMIRRSGADADWLPRSYVSLLWMDSDGRSSVE